MAQDIDDISARLLAIETVVGHLLTHLAVRDDDPSGWLATRRTLALRAADRVGGTDATEDLAIAMREAVAAFFDGADYAVRSPRASVVRQ